MKYFIWILIIASDLVINLDFFLLNSLLWAQDATTEMSPIRRLGIASVTSNTQEMRSLLNGTRRNSDARGLVSEALDDAKMRSELVDLFESSVQLTGRFWLAPNDAVKRASPPSAKDIATLQKNYDIDAWAKLDIRFTPDSTFYSVILTHAVNQQILAREDIVSRALPTRQEVKEIISSLLPRLISTLGHDGRVIFQSKNFVTLDFGSSRGVSKGSIVTAGKVYLSARHPRTGEPLSVWRESMAQLEVIEVTPSSAVAKVKAIRGPLPESMLAWVAFDPSKQIDVLKSDAPQKGEAKQGFAFTDESKPEIPKALAEAKVEDTKKVKAEPIQESKPEVTPAPTTTSKQPEFDDPSTWNLMAYNLGVGISLGEFYVPKKNAKRNTDMSDSVVNQINGSATFSVDKNILFRPRFEFSSFQGGDVEGTRGDLILPVLFDLGPTASGWQTLLGAGGNGTFGNAKARYVVPKYSRDFSDFALTGHGFFVSPPNENAQVKFDVNLDVTSALAGEFSTNLGICVQSEKNLPKELGITLRYNRSSFRWSQYTVGVDWDFGKNLKSNGQ